MYRLNDECGGQIGPSDESIIRQVTVHARVKATHVRLKTFKDRWRYNTAICAIATGKPIVVKRGMDMRKVKVPPCYMAVLGTLVNMFTVNDEHEYAYKRELFDEAGWRWTSHAELCTTGAAHRPCGPISERQIDSVLRAFAEAGIIERKYPCNEVTKKRTLSVRLCSDNVIALIDKIDAIKKDKIGITPPNPVTQAAKKGKKTGIAKVGNRVANTSELTNKDAASLDGGPYFNVGILYNTSSTSRSDSKPVTGTSSENAVNGDFKIRTVPVLDSPLEESAARFDRFVADVEATFDETPDPQQIAGLGRLYTSPSPLKRITLKLLQQYKEQKDMHAGKNSPDHNCNLDSFIKWWPGILHNMRRDQVAVNGRWAAPHLQELKTLPEAFEAYVANDMATVQSGYYGPPQHGLPMLIRLTTFLRLAQPSDLQVLLREQTEVRKSLFEAPAYAVHLQKIHPELIAMMDLLPYDMRTVKREYTKQRHIAVNLNAQMEVWSDKN